MAKCKHCGVEESEHCPGFEPEIIPDGCKCDPNEWDLEVGPICDSYSPVGLSGSCCKHCEHDEECHKKDGTQ